MKRNLYYYLEWGWGLGIGDWGLGIGDWGLGPIPNPQSPIPNPQSPIPNPQSPGCLKNKFNIFLYQIILNNLFLFKKKCLTKIIKYYFSFF